MNFGKGILIAFVLFATFIASLVYICVNENISLMSQNYYQDELKHQTKIDQMANAQSLAQRPQISFHEGELIVSFDQLPQVEVGEVRVLRPSDSSLDANFPLAPTTLSRQSFKLANWQHGLYRVSMKWTIENKDFFIEQVMVL